MKCIRCNENEPNKNSGLCSSCEKIEMKKIDGLLYLPALGLIINVFMYIFNSYSFIELVHKTYKENGFISYYSIGCIALLTIGTLITIITTWLFFNRRKSTKKSIIIYYSFNFALALYLTILPSILYHISLNENDIRTLTSSIFGLVVWIPYFMLSKRISVVFCR